jgi:1,2-diacylglycerol 3-alpha-glucosyltransferase
MIFVANVLTMNGGSTFILRACRELDRRKIKSTVLLLNDKFDPNVLEDIVKVANVVFLKDYLYDRGRLFHAHFAIFGSIDWPRLLESLNPSFRHVHVMGVFGLLFMRRLIRHKRDAVVSVGIYHQNEFLFRKLPWFLPSQAQESFRLFDAENIVFFNTSSRKNYSRFFNKDYGESPVLPIGVEISMPEPECLPPSDPPRIVSVGNLVSFKTYNWHVITTLSILQSQHPQLQYDIFGSGPELNALQVHAENLGVAERVHFKGTIPYSEFSRHVREAVLFVGSGTALIEAAHLGVPALIGIESSKSRETYGFLHEIEGFSYNEDNIDLPKVAIEDRIADILSDPCYRTEVGASCRIKAREFSIKRTMDGFLTLKGQAAASIQPLSGPGNARALLSLIGLGVIELLTGTKSFSDRRSQSYTDPAP